MRSIEIALATYNGARFLPYLLTSLARQTRVPTVIRVRDDGSHDDTPELLANARMDGLSIKLLNDGDGPLGVCANFGRVLEHCVGDYILLADQDDIWHPRKIEKLTALLESIEGRYGRSQPALVYSDSRLVRSDDGCLFGSAAKYQGFRLDSGLDFRRVLVQNVVQGCTMMFNRALLDTALPIPAEAVMHDWWLLLVATGLGHVEMLDEPLMDYQLHGKNTLGAQRWDVAAVLSKILNGPVRARAKVRAGFAEAIRQARSLHERFADELPSGRREFLERLLSLDACGPVGRRWLAARSGFRKEGWLRTLAFYYAL